MALLRKRYSSFGREDKTFGIRALIKGDSWLVRIGLYIILAAIFYVVVLLTNHRTSPTNPNTEQAPFPADSESE